MATKRFFVVLDVKDAQDYHEKIGVAMWVDMALGRDHRVDSTVYDSIEDMLADRDEQIDPFNVSEREPRCPYTPLNGRQCTNGGVVDVQHREKIGTYVGNYVTAAKVCTVHLQRYLSSGWERVATLPAGVS